MTAHGHLWMVNTEIRLIIFSFCILYSIFPSIRVFVNKSASSISWSCILVPLMPRADPEKALMLRKIEGRRRGRGWDGWMASPTRWTWVWAGSGVGDGQGGLVCCSLWGHKSQTRLSDWAELRDLFKKVRNTKGIFHLKMVKIKDRNGKDLTEAEKIKKRCQEYTEGTIQKRS